MKSNTAVLLLGFNRSDSMRRVLEKVQLVKPPRVYLAVDGPRSNKEGEENEVKKVQALAQMIDWECEINTLFRETNLGCANAVSSAITWFFDHEEYGIILEDDCVPHISFFRFCEELLQKYKDDDRIMHISGNNFQRGWKNDPEASYYFSQISFIWGWATWRRAWKHYDLFVREFQVAQERGYMEDFSFNGRHVRSNIMDVYHKISSGEKFSMWGYQWLYSTYIQSGLCITPSVNLIKNIGFEGPVSHAMDNRRNPDAQEIAFPLIHPSFISRDRRSDMRYIDMYYNRSTKGWIRYYLEQIIPKNYVAQLARILS